MMSSIMSTTLSFVLSCVFVLTLSGAAFAQTKSSPAAPPAAVDTRPMDPRQKLRRSIYMMEGALARAVEFGAKDLNRKLRSVIPEMMALSGAPQARGVYLEGYGVYFDVAVPVLNQVMMWSWGRVLAPDDGVATAINQLRAYIQNEKDPARRALLQAELGRIELQIGPVGDAAVAQAGPASPALASPSAPHAASDTRFDKRNLQDPNAINRAYTESVQNALVEAILEHGYPLALKPDEFLTIAARDNMQRDTLAPFDPFEEVVTILLRLRGSDLAAYRTGQIDETELRKRIEVREF
jgi:hypothetical protein